ncbi:hypothetical protein HQ447_16720 [bacterium]|nr:hypothetical protein [bacterium]
MKISAKEAARLARNYPLSVRWSDEDQVFVGSVPGLVSDCCHGDTPQEVIPQLVDIAEDLVSYLAAQGQIPSPPPAAVPCATPASQAEPPRPS